MKTAYSTILTAEQIWKAANVATNTLLGEIRLINRLFRAQDDSHKWPIRSKFNATERAIRQARKFQRDSGCAMSGLEYALFLEDAMGRIVNDERNW